MALNFNKLQDKHVLVIGGSSGIGRGIAEGVLAAKGKVTISSSSQTKIDKVVSELKAAVPGARVAGIAVDLSTKELDPVLSGLLTSAAKIHGKLDHIVYSAADYPPSGKLSDFTEELFVRGCRLRFIVPFSLAKIAAAEGHLERNRNSSITFTGGNVAVKPIRDWAFVNFIAAGLEGAVRGLALDLAPIRVNIVAPGGVNTEMWGDATVRAKVAEDFGQKMPTKSIGQVEDVAEAYLWLLRDANATGVVARTESGHNLV